MNKPLMCVLVASLLTACGGGGGASGASAPAAAAPAHAAAPAPAATTPAVVLEAPPAAPGINFNANRMTVGTSGSDYPITFSGATDLTVSGNLNRIWVAAAQAGGTVTVSGANNTIVFRPSAVPVTVTVTGSANTFYLPEGSPIKLEGAGAAMSAVKYYKP
ncbi:DUF3060 domain-containing protein [Massilia sp. GCM10023247]|uniref:DUF3060 domain-containing protein n=1 Tax=Massilia sp. GCM10023247 TaxID=3252643 RepID=UPI003619D5F6